MALFKIFNNIDNPRVNTQTGEPILPDTYNKGYMYFDASTNLFYIDTAGTGGNTGTRVKLNAWGAKKAEQDGNGDKIDTTYLKIADAGDIISGEAEKVKHKLTFGAGGTYVFDGSADVTVPVYTGGIA